MTRVEQSSIEVGQFTLGRQINPTARPVFKQWVRRSSKLGPLAQTKESINDAAVFCGVIPPHQSHQKASAAPTSPLATGHRLPKRGLVLVSRQLAFSHVRIASEVQPSEPMLMRSLMFSTSPSASRWESSKESILSFSPCVKENRRCRNAVFTGNVHRRNFTSYSKAPWPCGRIW